MITFHHGRDHHRLKHHRLPQPPVGEVPRPCNRFIRFNRFCYRATNPISYCPRLPPKRILLHQWLTVGGGGWRGGKYLC